MCRGKPLHRCEPDGAESRQISTLTVSTSSRPRPPTPLLARSRPHCPPRPVPADRASYIGRLETRLLAVENLLAAQASMVQLRNSEPSAGASEGSPDGPAPRGRELDDSPQRQPKRVRTGSPSSSTANTDASSGETFVNLKGNGLEDDNVAPDTVLDGMGALNLGDEEDYGYFGACATAASGPR